MAEIMQQKHNEDDLRSAIRFALSGSGVLFLGAGASKNAFDKKGKPLPTGQELADSLAAECGLGQGYPLDSITEHFIDVRSETTLINVLRKNLNVKDVGSALVSLSNLDWLRVWTTNYDDSYEKALEKDKKNYFSLTTSASVTNAQGNKRIIFHINGFLPSLKQTITKDFVLTSQSYATQKFIDSEWATVFRNDVQQAKSIIIIGYSLADIDVARLVFNPEIFHKKIHFIDREEIDPVLKSKLSKFGQVHPIGLEGVAKIIDEELSTWVKPEYVEEYRSWQKVEIEGGLAEASDDDFYELLLQGEIKDGLVLEQLNKPDKPLYTVVRSCEEKSIRQLGEDNSIVAVVGSFANGKTTSIRSIALKLTSEGQDVFYLDHPYDSAYTELQKLCRREDDFVLVIENYARNLDLVECFCRYARPGCNLIISERTELHELTMPVLNDRIKERELHIHEIDIMDNEELKRLSMLLDERGLWGERVGLFENQKIDYLREDCGRQLQSVLIEVAKSPIVQEKLTNIVSHFESIDGGLRILIGLCLIQAIGEQPRIDAASEILKLDFDSFSKLSKDEVTKQIVGVQSGIASFRSPVMASAVLKGLSPASVVTEIVSECVINGHNARQADDYIGTISKELMRYGNLERILPDKGKRQALQNLYEEIKSVPTIRSHPHYWLQYAMARLSLGDMDIARRYFEQSYSYAEKIKGYDTFQIDNHYCRLLLKEAEDTTDSDEAYKSVDEALSTLKKQVQRENRHYPYRSAWSLEGVVKRHQHKWTPEQKKSVVSASKYLEDAATRLEPHVARSVSVVGGLQRLKKVVEALS